MLRTPLKNSKNVNKPFKSPFESPAQNIEQKKLRNKNIKQESEIVQSPSSTRTVEAKRILLLDEDEREKKRRKIIDCEEQNVQVELSENITKSDLLALKRKIFEMRQELDCLKSRERCTKKHDPKELKSSINKWKAACQNALETLCSELRERNGESTKISDVLNMLGIPETVVHYSEKDDAFT